MNKRKKFYENSAAATIGAFAIAFGAGFILSGTDMAGVSSFADISIAGALTLPASTAVLTGSLLHCIIGHDIGKNIVKITAMVLIIIAKMFFEPKNDPKVNGVTTAVSIFAAGTAVSALIGEIPYKLIFYIFYGGLAGFTAYSSAYIFSGLRKKFVLDFSTATGCAYAVVYTVLTSSLCSISIPYINLGLIFGTTVTLLGAYYYCHTGGVMCGALTACGAFLSSVECGMSVVLLPASALLTGYMNRQKNTTAAMCFVGINFTLMILTGVTQNSIYSMLDIVFASVLFLAVSPTYSDKWVTTGNDVTSALPEVINARMNFLSGTMKTIRTESEKISAMLFRNNEKNVSTQEVINAVCTCCNNKSECWQKNYSTSKEGFRKLSEMTEFSAENFPYELRQCIYSEGIMRFYKKAAREKAESRLMSLRYSDNMSLLSEQIKTMEEIIDSVGESPDMRYSAPISKMVTNKLNKFGFFPSDIISYYNAGNRLHIELYFNCRNAPENFTRVCDLVSDELKIHLDCASPVNSGEKIRIRLFEHPEYKLDVYVASICAEDAGENGDTSAVFSDGTGMSYVVLSDGMGSGKSAAVESRMVVQMFRRLIGSGVGYQTAIKLINSVMVTKSPEETFATLDVVRVDLDTCGLTIIKSGASATLIRHAGNVMKVVAPTFPIGIYSRSETFSCSYDFEEGDIIIMFSDGISETEYRFIKELLLSTSDIKKIVDEICAKADVFNPTLHADDITVIGIRAGRSSE